MARAMPFQDLEMLKSWRAVRGRRGSGAGGVGGSSRGASTGSPGFFWRDTSALVRLPPIALEVARPSVAQSKDADEKRGWKRKVSCAAAHSRVVVWKREVFRTEKLNDREMNDKHRKHILSG